MPKHPARFARDVCPPPSPIWDLREAPATPPFLSTRRDLPPVLRPPLCTGDTSGNGGPTPHAGVTAGKGVWGCVWGGPA